MQLQLLLVLYALAFTAVLCKPFPSVDPTCGYASCHPPVANKLNVHLIPHSHDDVGWLKTVDQYYYGTNYTQQRGVRGVQYIIDSVVQALQENPDRRFIQVETAFFHQWWKQQTDNIKAIVKDLVDQGRLEIVGGAWSMNDEAATNYQAIIDQFTLGLRTVKDLLGECGRPKIGWQIDPFGHTREMASIFAQLGYEALFFTRLDYRDSEKRSNDLNREFVWRGSPDLGESSDIFTSLIYRFYNAPDYFCWDVQCGDTPIVTDTDSPEYNLDERVDVFAAYVKEQEKVYNTKNVLVTMGGDFTYQQAEMYYMNMDKLIAGFANHPEINVMYSTPSCYVKAVNDEATSRQLIYSLKEDDFMPYASDKHSYWTGYYTSRPNSKRFERQANNLLQVTKQLAAFGKAKGKNNMLDDLTDLKEVMGIMQHHDAITGTEKQHVANDYVKMLTRSSKKAEAHVNEVIAELLRVDQNTEIPDVPVQTCMLTNVSRCAPSAAERFVVALYNPLSRPVSHYVRLPVTSINYNVIGMKGIEVATQVVPSLDKFEDVEGETPSLYELVFEAKSVPAMGIKYFYVERVGDDVNNEPGAIKPEDDKYVLGTETSGFEIDQETGFLKSVTLNGKTINVKQEFLFYSSSNGTNVGPELRASGAYIFRPDRASPVAKQIATKANKAVYSGPLFDEVQQEFDSWIKQSIRVYKKDNHIEFDWIVGPIEYRDQLGVEVITRFTTDLKSEGEFFTDSNGRGLIKRTRDHRETYTYTNEEPVSGNYYPVTSRIVLKDVDQKLELAVLNDRAQGGSSLKDGQVELMIHRRLRNDDDFGVSEVLNETEYGKGVVVRGQHYLVLGTDSGKSAAQQHDLVQRKMLPPWMFVGDVKKEEHSKDEFMSNMRFKWSGLMNPLPENVQLLTLEPWDDTSLLLRLEHIFEKDEDPELSKAVTVNLKDILTLFEITSIEEMTLGANQLLVENEKLKWSTQSSRAEVVESKESRAVADADLQIELGPMEIRTFIVGVQTQDKTEEETCEGDECDCENCDSGDGGGGAGSLDMHGAVIFLLAVAYLFC